MAQLLNNVGTWWVQAGILVCLGAALVRMLKIRGGARLHVWQMVLIACTVLPWIRPWHSREITVASARPAAMPTMFHAPHANHTVARVSPYEINSAEFILSLLGLGVAIRLAWFGLGLIKLARYRRQGRAIILPAEWLGISSQAQFLLSDEIQGPATFGFAPPAVLLPAEFPGLPQQMRDAILLHELKHVERRDWLFTALEEIVGAVFWFHPAIWFVLGEIQLAREQTVDRAVIATTRERETYLDTLLAMAGVAAPFDPAAAQSFLRRRQLKKRVKGIVEECKMSKTKLTIAQMAAVAAMAVSCWYVAGAIPLEGQPRVTTIADGDGVSVNLNGLALLHRSGVTYPPAALATGVEGTVVVQIHLDANGEVTDSAILSGPDELRRNVQQAVAGWHFDKSVGSSVHVLDIDFRKPASLVSDAPRPINAVRIQRAAIPAIAVEPRQQDQTRKVAGISVTGLSDSAHDRFLAQLPVRLGDEWSDELMRKTQENMRGFDAHLSLMVNSMPDGVQLTIRAPDGATGEFPASSSPNAIRISSGVAASSLVTSVRPVYPPLAKAARQQGTVKLEATIGKDGTVQDLKVISGPPLLVPSALTAVKQWVYKPLLMNGQAQDVLTTVDINFSLSNDVPALGETMR